MNENDVRTEFASAVKFCRRKLGLSQEELAERADLHRTYISDVERGTRNLSLHSISKLAAALEVTIPDLFALPKGPGEKSGQERVGPGPGEFVEILLVEDSANDAELTLHAFKQSRFANLVHVVRDGAEALDYLFAQGKYIYRQKKDRPQVILLDLNLPKVNGLEVLRRIKADSRTKSIPVVVLTVSQKNRDVEECRTLGVEAYIVKPVDLHRLSEVTPQLNLDWALFKSEPALEA